MPQESQKNKIIASLCENHALALLGVESSDEEDEAIESFLISMSCLLNNRRSVHFGLPKCSSWQRNVLRNLDESRFNQMLRVRPEECERILELIKNDAVFKTSSSASELPIELQLKIVLYRLGSSGDGQSVRKVASLFGVGDGGTIKNVTQRIFKAILRLKNEFLYWPNERERLEIVSATGKEMPGCVGYIDGSEIKLAEAPVMQHEIYYSRKRQYSVKLQAICDYKLRIRQVTIGFPGSVHDAKIFSNCSLAKHPERFLSTSQWVAGDSAYPLKPYLITPFRQNSVEHRKEERDLFNAYFSKYRVRIENCFGLLKEKFGSLKELKFRMLSTSYKKECNDWIMVCCILHNMLISFDIDNENSNEVLMPQFPLSSENNMRNCLLRYIQNQNI
uniref:Putative nuclease HARBI1 n=1 Tax=Bactrocera dorsalis TaxID=27457 RepID=A0A034WKI8_BACDO